MRSTVSNEKGVIVTKFLTIATSALVATLGLSSATNAATFKGYFWDAPAETFNANGTEIGNPNGAGLQNAIDYANSLIDTPTATFSATALNYGDAGTNWDIGSLSEFLNADAGSISSDTANIQESVFKFVGKAYFEDGMDYWVTSDDGFRLVVNGNDNVFEYGGNRAPGSTSTVTWDRGTGIFDIVLWYYEGNETQVQLVSNIAPVPLPASGLLVLGAMGGLGLAARRRNKSK